MIGEITANRAHGLLGQSMAGAAVERNRRAQGRGQGFRIAGLEQPAGAPLGDDFLGAAMVGPNHRPAHGQRLGQGAAESLGPGRGGNHHVRQHIGGGKIAGEIDETDQLEHPALPRALLDRREVIAAGGIGAHHDAEHVPAAETRQRLDQKPVALPAREPPRHEDHLAVIGKIPVIGDLDHAFLGDVPRGECVKIDAAVNHAQARGVELIGVADMGGHEPGNGDHPLPPGHHRVVAALE